MRYKGNPDAELRPPSHRFAYDIPVYVTLDPQGPYNWFDAYYTCTIAGDPSWWHVYKPGTGKYDYTVNRGTGTEINWPVEL